MRRRIGIRLRLSMKYNIWNAIAYEVTVMLINFDARWMNNKIVNMIRAHSFVDWCEWKTEQTMEDVDAQIEALHMLWDREDDDWRDVIIEEDEETGAIFGYTFEIKSDFDKIKDD